MHKLVVIIDDDPISVLVCETMLRKSDFTEKIKTFSNGKDALTFLDNHYEKGNEMPDFIFLDIQMPEISGWDFIEAYGQFSNIPVRTPHVVMLSATFDPDDQRKANDNSLIINFISKPITKEALQNLSKSK
ncbi:response regulator [Cryomorpha ignava]|uniref:Response regulator n=1 Tax=Cryomorpha ignava TaxID=101383 RepID=A0A7K3WUI8_9FLAO|nr:response regulator [Cryomorpha ignava]NEN24711.1 response regulator [Cryomorpha ignava]